MYKIDAVHNEMPEHIGQTYAWVDIRTKYKTVKGLKASPIWKSQTIRAHKLMSVYMYMYYTWVYT